MFFIILLLTFINGCTCENKNYLSEENQKKFINLKTLFIHPGIPVETLTKINLINLENIMFFLLKDMLKKDFLYQHDSSILLNNIKDNANISLDLDKIYFFAYSFMKKNKLNIINIEKIKNMFNNFNYFYINNLVNILKNMKIKYLCNIKISQKIKILKLYIQLILIDSGEIIWDKESTILLS